MSVRSPVFAQLMKRSVRAWIEAGFLLATIAILIVGFRHAAAGLPVNPWMESDSNSYLEYWDIRPHGYPLFLGFHQILFGGLRHLPTVQACFYYSAVAALSLAIALRTGTFVLVLPFAAVSIAAPDLDFGGVMSDTTYAAWLAFGMTAFVFYQYWKLPAWLALASFCFGFAAITRTIGYVPLAVFAFIVMLEQFISPRDSLRRNLLAVVPAALLLLIAATSNQVHNGQFRIGSWGGASLSGKGFVLAKTLPPTEHFSRYNWIPPLTEPARSAIARSPNIVLRMYITRQYYEYLRYKLIWKELEVRDAAWREGERTRNDAFSKSLAKSYVRNDPWGYAGLVLTDYLAMWTVPRFVTEREVKYLGEKYAAMGEIPYLSAFAHTEQGKENYFLVVPPPRPPARVYIVRLASASFLVLTIAVAIFLLRSLRKVRNSSARDLLFAVGAVNATYLATAIMESAYERYVTGTWPLMAAALAFGVRALFPGQLRVARDAQVIVGTGAEDT